MIVSLTIVVDFFVKGVPQLTSVSSILKSWSVFILVFPAVLGMIQLTKYRGQTVLDAKSSSRDKGLAIIFLVLMWGIFLFGVLRGSRSTEFKTFTRVIWGPLTTAATTEGLIMGVVIYRIFKFKTWDTLLFGVFMLIYLIASNTLLTIGPAWIFVDLQQWILTWPSNAGAKTMTILFALGMLFIGFRTIIGLEKGSAVGGE
jgi:hypothetical protein